MNDKYTFDPDVEQAIASVTKALNGLDIHFAGEDCLLEALKLLIRARNRMRRAEGSISFNAKVKEGLSAK